MVKSLLNAPADAVLESIDGFVATNTHLARLDAYPSIKVVYDKRHNGDSCVAVISGGGSGHEPAFVGYVGSGMLAAAVAGDIFAAPPEDAVFAAISQVTGKAGALIVINNYTGDRLTFGAATERAKAEGFAVELVIVGDDCALAGNKSAVGRRGLAGCIFALKIAGASAATGMPLLEVRDVTQRVIDSMGTVGCSLTTCTVPGQAPSARLGPDEMEIGLGLHGEPGARRRSVKPLDSIIAELVDLIAGRGVKDAADADTEGRHGDGVVASHLPIYPGDRLALLLNNLGGATQLEMGIAARAAVAEVTQGLEGVILERVYVGTMVSSLDMHGLSVTLLNVGGPGPEGNEILSLLDKYTDAPGWPRWGGIYDTSKRPTPLPTVAVQADAACEGHGREAATSEKSAMATMKKCITSACTYLIHNEDILNAMDAAVGDGDCGSTLGGGARAVLSHLDDVILQEDPADTALALARVLGRAMGGTSGGIYKIMWTSIAGALKTDGGGSALTLRRGEYHIPCPFALQPNTVGTKHRRPQK